MILMLSSSATVFAQYVESSRSLGIDHISINPNLIGGGVLSFDYNNDGWQDLYFTSGTGKDVLYKNINGEDFESLDIPGLSFTSRYNTSSAISADFNNDGCQDILVTTLSLDPNLVFINNCDGSFDLEYLHVRDEDGEYVSSAGSFASDFDGDGLLDIYLLNYVKEHHFLEDLVGSIIGYDHDCYTNSVLINQGDFSFDHLVDSDLRGSGGCTLAGSSTRFLGVGHNGAYIVNDFGEWIYPNEARDKKLNAAIGVEEAIYGMGVAIADIDNDEDYDLYLTNIGKNKLLINNNGSYKNEAVVFDVENELVNDSTSVVSWGTMFLDFDNDAKLDLFVSNGYVPVADFLSSSIVNQNKLFRNDISEFTDITEVSGLASNGIHRGAIKSDLNNDGLLDIVTSVVSDSDLGTNDIKRSKVFINEFSSNNNYLQIFFEGVESNRNAYNAEVKVYAEKEVYSQLLLSGTSYASQNFSVLHFGLSDNETVDSIRVLWPSGIETKLENIDTNQRLLIKEGMDQAFVPGCIDAGASNYMPSADINFGCKEQSTSTHDQLEELLTIFPNPSKGPISVRFENGNDEVYFIQVYNNLGQKVFSKKVVQRKDVETINLKDLTAGSYKMQLITSDQKVITRSIHLIN